MNIDLIFQDWSLLLTDACVQQYDNLAQTVRIAGDLPEGWNWKLRVAVYGERYLNSIPLTLTDGVLMAVLTGDDLAFGDTVYTLQLVGEKGAVLRHTNPVRLYVGASIPGEGVWPELPRSISDAERAAEAAASRAQTIADGIAADVNALSVRLDALVVLDEEVF